MQIKSILAASVAFGALSTGAGAQTTTAAIAADGDTDAIIVTGSRIRQDPLAQSSPVIVVDQTSIARTGISSIADILQRLPSAAGGLNTRVNNSGNIGNPPDGGGVGAGSANIDLRYLGAKRTLVLVDGIRFVSGTSASGIPATVDLNTIPANMIERIEVLQSGQSPLYGSDAIAGVVNIITRENQEGLQLSGQFGTYRQGDGHTQDYQASYGIKGPTTSVVFGASYVKQESVRTADRSTSQFPNPGQTSCGDPIGGCSSAIPNGRFTVLGLPNLTLKAPVPGRPRFDAANPTGPNSDFRAFTTGDSFNFAPLNYFLTPSERYGGWISAKQELSESVNFRVKALYNRRNSQNQAAFLPLFVGPDAGNGNLLDTISIDATNPFNPFGVTLSAGKPGEAPANYSTVRRRLNEAGQRTYTQQVDTMSLTGGFDGSFDVGGRKWYWDANAVIGFNNARQLFTGNVNAAKLAQALGPVSLCTGECVPFNIFGGLGSVTPAMLSFVGFDERSRSSQELQDYTANLSGDLFDLPAGAVGFAVGYEHRYQKGTYDPDPIIVAGLGSDIPSQPSRGAYNSDEVYGELRVPLLADKPFFQLLEIDGAVRHANYSTSGSSTTYTGSGQWKPVDDLLLRASYATGFRAPSIGELFGAASRSDAPIDDPCTNVAGSPWQTSAAVRTNCIANGVPANGSYQEPNGGQVSVTTGGNTALRPEKSRTWLFGGVYSPVWARESGFASVLSLEANYYDINVTGAIAPIDAAITLQRCAFGGEALSCSAISRTPNGLITRVNGLLQNIGEVRTKGIDVMFNYRSRATSAGAFGLSVNGNFLLKYTESTPSQNGFTVTDYRGKTRGFPDQSYPKFKGIAIVDWQIADFGAAFTGRYIDAVFEADGKKLKGTFYGDVQLSYNPSFLDKRMAFTVGVNNVFNQNPPPCFSCTGPNYDPTTYDVPGQFGYLRISYKM
ncbi:TonB-dependent receptor domain-containing protein [Polymorphobacter fuscus]|uniref:TonB-dependent receptor n=1 Tax=Sandarakinorhabdus fusca TaxID=1439888 RepID=A0A7C9GYI3_9SPHN|nr:TonB-dependent receptor [Polymorphobacter fuscus]KAB7645536.1 TonB-dependent receptor [Polymorphobacter fuscus]MQT17974.1 TonB-dependent receptor [Polymorphobacter fuscus]NJC08604.1 iron complex outermembrane receptor protein [Polymorphobacter fuscus]